MTNIVMAERCHYCSKFRHPKEIAKIGTGGAKICFQCQERHEEALKILSGSPPRGCQECGVTFKQLEERQGSDVKMALVFKDGIYQILCDPCADLYVPARRDLYGPTLFGKQRNLIA